MPIYVYQCSQADTERTGPGADVPGHFFEAIVPMSQCDTPQPCPKHGGECPQVEYPGSSPWVWGLNETHWSAGTAGNLTGMNHAKRHT